jgi:hypothetical protein
MGKSLLIVLIFLAGVAAQPNPKPATPTEGITGSN